MVQVVYEYPAQRPSTGPFEYELPHVKGSVPIGPDLARRRAMGYLAMWVALSFEAGEPMLLLGESARWRMPIVFNAFGRALYPSTLIIEVDAETGEVAPLTPSQIEELHAGAVAILGTEARSAAT